MKKLLLFLLCVILLYSCSTYENDTFIVMRVESSTSTVKYVCAPEKDGYYLYFYGKPDEFVVGDTIHFEKKK